VVLFAIAADPWRVNRALWSTPPYDAPADDVLHWLRTHDDGAYAIESHNSLIVSVASVGHIQYAHEVLNSVWPPRPRLLPTPAAPDGGVFAPAPKYVVSRKVPQLPPGTLLAELPGGVVLRAPPGLPFSFVADPLRLPYGVAAGASALADRRVAEVPARFDGTNRVIAQVPSGAPDSYTTLVVMQTWAPGWTVIGPSGRRPAERLGGFVGSSSVRPGQTYVFSYLPQSFLAGSAISLMGLAVSIALVIAEWGPRHTNSRPP
jgi:hypothetical protein